METVSVSRLIVLNFCRLGQVEMPVIPVSVANQLNDPSFTCRYDVTQKTTTHVTHDDKSQSEDAAFLVQTVCS